MFDSWFAVATLTAAIGAGLMAGVYFAFSGFIMRSFDQLGAEKATEVMNVINEIILRSWFMALFFGSSLLYALLSLIALTNTEIPGRWLVISAGLVYVIGMFLCTAIFNVPLNNRLAAAGENQRSLTAMWALYYLQWTRWNHIRTASSLLSFLLSMYFLAAYV